MVVPLTLNLCESPVDEQLDSCDIAVIRREKYHGFGNLIGCSEPAERGCGRSQLPSLLTNFAGGQQLIQTRRFGGARAHGVHSNAAIPLRATDQIPAPTGSVSRSQRLLGQRQREHRYAEALTHAHRSAEQFEAFLRLGDASQTDLAQVAQRFGNIALVQMNMHLYEEAIPYARREVELAESVPAGADWGDASALKAAPAIPKRAMRPRKFLRNGFSGMACNSDDTGRRASVASCAGCELAWRLRPRITSDSLTLAVPCGALC
jgi:hypothetical protein